MESDIEDIGASMIKLEYDVNTAGVRVSFVLRDGPKSSDVLNAFDAVLGRSEGGKKIIPQTVETLDTVMRILEAAREHEME